MLILQFILNKKEDKNGTVWRWCRLSVKVPVSIEQLKSGAIRGRLTYEGHTFRYTSKKIGVDKNGKKKYEGEDKVKKEVEKQYDAYKKAGKVSTENATVKEWVDHWLVKYKKPLDTAYEGEEKIKHKKGGRVTMPTYARMLSSYELIKKYDEGRILLGKKLSQVTTDNIQVLVSRLEEEGYSASTVKKTILILNGAFEKAVRSKKMDYNPCYGVEREPDRADIGKVSEEVFIKKEDFDKVFKEALRKDEEGNYVHDFGAGVVLQLLTGCRSGELRSLSWNDIYEDELEIHHSVSWVPVLDENGNRTGNSKVYLSAGKSRASNRRIPFDSSGVMAECICILKERFDKISEGSRYIKRDRDLVLPTKTGWYITPNNYNKAVKRIVEAIYPESDITSHALRHAFISLLINDENADAAAVASYVGHSDLRITLRYAAHTDKEKKRENSNTIASLINKE